MNKEQAQTMITILSQRFRINPPCLRIAKRLYYKHPAYFIPLIKTIFISEKALTSEKAEDILLHEFAHYICTERKELQTLAKAHMQEVLNIQRMLSDWKFCPEVKKKTAKKAAKKKVKKDCHDKEFSKCLLMTVLVWKAGDCLSPKELGQMSGHEEKRK